MKYSTYLSIHNVSQCKLGLVMSEILCDPSEVNNKYEVCQQRWHSDEPRHLLFVFVVYSLPHLDSEAGGIQEASGLHSLQLVHFRSFFKQKALLI